MPIIAPSLLSANFLNLDADCKMLNESQADWYHLDVMDGRFVPNISFGPMLVSFFRKATTKVCDVHLMIEEPANTTAACPLPVAQSHAVFFSFTKDKM